MKLKKIVVISLIVFVILIVAFYLTRKRYIERNTIFQFVTIERGDIKNTITSTGILHPRSRVEVGTQISGTFSRVYVDFNDVVKKGQILAELDKKMLIAALNEAKAILLHSQEKLSFSKIEYTKKKELFESGFLAEIEFLKFKSDFIIDSSAFLSANANLTRAYTNLEYAEIISPIGGTIIERNVEAGQTVAANFNTPTLFVIAEDLSEMEIHAAVDESDISNVFEGQSVEFSVLAYPDSVFTGVIDEIRLQPRMLQNVVNYIVVINAENKSGLLLPGMTATVDFIINQKKNVLMVAQDALNFRPPKKMAEKFFEKMKKMNVALPDSMQGQMPQPPPPRGQEKKFSNFQSPGQSPPPQAGTKPVPDSRRMSRQSQSPAPDINGQPGAIYPPSINRNYSDFPEPGTGANVQADIQSSENIGQLWYLDKNGELALEPVMKGVSDGSNTEIVMYKNLHEGMQVISGIVQPSKNKESDPGKNVNQIFGETQQGGGGPPPPQGGP